MIAPRNSPRVTYLWHHEIHSRIGNEQLIFVLAGFDPVYRRERALEETRTAIRDLQIRSYAIWELIGAHDLMIQAWLPAGVRTDDFVERLGNSVSVEVDTMPMAVQSFISHWMWQEIDLNQVEKTVSSEDYSHLNEGWVPAANLRRYQNAGYIHRTPQSKRVKAFILITNPHRSTSPRINSQIQEDIEKLFASDILTNAVVMKVSGGASYLITGRLASSNFAAFGDLLQGTFAKSGVLESLRCRTNTHFSDRYVPLERVEQLLPLTGSDATYKPGDDDLQSWLSENESDDLEFKSSAFTDIDHKIGLKDKPRTKSEQVHDIAKAVVGMLNAVGGTVIIGVAELAKYSAEQLLQSYPDCVETGNRMVIGVDHEFVRGGWDTYQLKLAGALRKAIDGEIDGWLKYYAMQLGSRTICVIRIRRPSSWFYVRATDKNGNSTTEFYGRTGGETQLLRGQRMDQFKEANPRTTRADVR